MVFPSELEWATELPLLRDGRMLVRHRLNRIVSCELRAYLDPRVLALQRRLAAGSATFWRLAPVVDHVFAEQVQDKRAHRQRILKPQIYLS
jgi:hypothetical protein